MTDWRTWLLFVFTNNDDVGRSMTDEELKQAVCRRTNAPPELVDAAKHAVMEWRLHGQLTDSCRVLEAALAKAKGRRWP